MASYFGIEREFDHLLAKLFDMLRMGESWRSDMRDADVVRLLHDDVDAGVLRQGRLIE
jgi:hypothetical protein